ncbi:hypothetical protein QJS04_geneDACA009858 [Acorus gramineus]|uniref:Uncharacterized protein n=1 Tax=Acorus gramineus TaxID=55184 RepID=A0AAV9B7Z6_ACOGR|nr:hypothetical protein QJS04_geneDACA009858 [Acorus gramineus]
MEAVVETGCRKSIIEKTVAGGVWEYLLFPFNMQDAINSWIPWNLHKWLTKNHVLNLDVDHVLSEYMAVSQSGV